MAKFTRKNLPAGKFGKFGKGKFGNPGMTKGKPPNNFDKKVAKGNLSPEAAAKIKHKAPMVLGEADSKYHNC